MNAAPTPDPDDDIPEYLRDVPPADEDAPSVTTPDPLEPLATLPLPTPALPAPKAAVVQMPGTKKKAGGKHGQPHRKPVDMERLALDYAAGLLSIREMAAKHDRSVGYIVGKAKDNGWQRDIRSQARIKSVQIANAHTASLARAAQLNARLPEPREIVNVPPEVFTTQSDDVAASMAHVRTKHRDIIREARDVLAGLLREVRSLASVGDIVELYDAALGKTDPTERATALKHTIDRITALPSRVYGINKLSVAAKNIIALERQAFDLDAPDEGATPPPREKDVSPEEVYLWLVSQKPGAV